MGPIDGDPSADDDQAITDTKNDLGHGLLGMSLDFFQAEIVQLYDHLENSGVKVFRYRAAPGFLV